MELVVTQQADAAGGARKRVHSVRQPRHPQTIAHGLANAGNNLIAKALGQVEYTLSITDQRAVSPYRTPRPVSRRGNRASQTRGHSRRDPAGAAQKRPSRYRRPLPAIHLWLDLSTKPRAG